MKQFALALGESHFALSLDPRCAELLTAFYSTAGRVEDTPSDSSAHQLEVRETDQGFEIEANPPPQAGATLPVGRRLNDPASAMLALEEEIERLVIAETQGLLALHGGAVLTPTGPCLVLGNSGSGKSSTTFQLAELGHLCLCEEVTLWNPSSGLVVPYPQTLSLSEALIAEFSSDFPIRGRLHRLIPSVVRYEPPQRASSRSTARAVTRILLPRFQPGALGGFTPLTAEAALPEVLGYSFQPNVEPETQFDRMIALLERAEITRFVYPNAAFARAALTALSPT